MTTQEMMKHTSALGGWKNIAKIDEPPDWIEDYPPETIDPNIEYLFGYEANNFLQKQYK